MKVLAIVAHPDDEALGCGGTLLKHVCSGDEVYVLYLSEGSASRGKGEDVNRVAGKDGYLKALGAKDSFTLNFPDNKFDSVALLDIVKEVEKVIKQIEPEVIYTHYHGDLNIDHQVTNRAVLTAARPQPGTKTKKVLAFEVLSSTEWNSSQAVAPFNPNYHVDISEQLEEKIKCLKNYDVEMRDEPHTRSYKNVKNLAELRGASVGVKAAESFYLERWMA